MSLVTRCAIARVPSTDPAGPVADLATIESIVRSIDGLRAGYVLDVAVTRAHGALEKTVLVEVNDGFSFGIYAPSATTAAFDVLAARWRELIATK
jgi:hypothetical protein